MDGEVKKEIDWIKGKLLSQQKQILHLATALERMTKQQEGLYESLHKLLDLAGISR